MAEGQSNPDVRQGHSPGGGSGGGDSDDKKKCRKTRVKRFHGVGENGKKFWVDVEILHQSSYDGRQWPGPDEGNAQQSTVLSLIESDGAETVRVYMDPEKQDEDTSVPVKTIACQKFSTRGSNVQRSYINDPKKNTCREEKKRRIAFNDIAHKWLDGDGNPPDKPKKYKDAVRATKDKCDLFLDVARAHKVTHDRGKGRNKQRVKTSNMWGDGKKAGLDGESKDVRQKGHEPIRLTPTMTVINFGPDALAVKFDGTGRAAGASAGATVAANAMFGGIAGNLTQGAS